MEAVWRCLALVCAEAGPWLCFGFWEAIGILQNLDFEQWRELCCTKEQKLWLRHGIDERLLHAVANHGCVLTVDIKPGHKMEKVLYATNRLTGLICAVTFMRPSNRVADLEVKSVKKGYWDKKMPQAAPGK